MRSSTRLLTLFGAAFCLAALTAPRVSAQGIKMGFIKDDRIKQEYKAWQKAQEQWELEAKAWEDEAQQMQTELKELEEEFDRQKLILSDDKKKEREASIRVKRESLDAYTRRVFGPNGDAERKQTDLLAPLLDNISKAIEAVAIENSYDVIFTLQSGLGYINESFDVTDKVLVYLEDQDG
ncbi:MAG: OmpH family outer membrane protein [Candidatus Zixiibacteriota bacterium]